MNPDRQFVTFYVEDRLYGLDVRIAKEINPTVAITWVPRTPPYIKGLVNIRGQVVLVLDIAIIFGKGPQQIQEESQIVILKTGDELRAARQVGIDVEADPFGDKPIGLLVDRIGDVISVPDKQVEPPPQHLDEVNARYFSGVVKQGESLLVLLNAAEMLSQASASTKSTEEQGS